MVVMITTHFHHHDHKVSLFTHLAIPLSPTLCEAGLTMNTGSAAIRERSCGWGTYRIGMVVVGRLRMMRRRNTDEYG